MPEEEFSCSLIITNCADLIAFQNWLLSINHLEIMWKWVFENESMSERYLFTLICYLLCISSKTKWQVKAASLLELVSVTRAYRSSGKRCWKKVQALTESGISLNATCSPVIPIHKSQSKTTERARQKWSRLIFQEMSLKTVKHLELIFQDIPSFRRFELQITEDRNIIIGLIYL